MILVIKIFVVLLGSFLFWYGGFKDHNFRRFYLPPILALAAWFITHDWRVVSMLSVIGIYCLGYGDKSPLRHCFGNGWGRGIWGLLAGLCLSLPLYLTGHLVWYWFLAYLTLNFTLENALKNIPQDIGDIIIGAGFCSIILLIR